MKAKEYFEKYGSYLVSGENADKNDRTNAAVALLCDLCGEVQSIGEQRKIKRIEAVISIVKETNDKWNAVGNLCEKHYGVNPLAENGFKAFILNRMPELRMVWK